MKKFAIATAGLCAAMFLAACNSTEKQNTAAGAVGEKSCCTADAKCEAKCTGDAKTCTKADCCQKKGTDTTKTAAPGAVGDEKKDGCCSAKKASCCPAMQDGATCPVTGKTTNG